MRPNILTILASILIVLSFPPWGFYPLIWVALVPWLLVLRRTKDTKDAFIQGVWFSFLISILAFYWVAYVLHNFAELPWWLAGIGLLLFGLVGQAQALIFAPLYRWLRNDTHSNGPRSLGRSLLFSLAAAALYTGIDWILPKLFVDTLGHCFWQAERFRQVADLGGAALLTFIIVWTNEAVLEIYEHRKQLRSSLRQWFPHAAIAACLIISSWTYGWFREAYVQEVMGESTRSIRMGVIQANIGDFDKLAAESGVRGASERVVRKFFSMSDEALKDPNTPEALIWPETSYPSTFRTPITMDELQRDERVAQFARSRNVSLLFGGYDRKDNRDYNAFFFLSPRKIQTPIGEGDVQVYRKNILLLFGEYIPLSDTFTFLKTAFPQVGNFGRGSGPEVLDVIHRDPALGPVKVGPIICYEALFPNYIIAAARKGSQMILNITNDSWFGPYGEPFLHFSLITFRSIETRLPQLRATNTGISALILPDGTVSAKTDINREDTMNVSVPLTKPIWTLMKAWGDWFGPFSLILGLMLALFSYWKAPGAPRKAQ
jgi:apolipoprotein N-acyltransferase